MAFSVHRSALYENSEASKIHHVAVFEQFRTKALTTTGVRHPLDLHIFFKWVGKKTTQLVNQLEILHQLIWLKHPFIYSVLYTSKRWLFFFPQLRRQKEALYRKKQRERLVEWPGELRVTFLGGFF